MFTTILAAIFIIKAPLMIAVPRIPEPKIQTAKIQITQDKAPKIRVTNGRVTQDNEKFDVETGSSRFDLLEEDGDNLSINVKYQGRTKETSLLGSGQFVSQVGIKLRSVNTCNLVYVARRFEPKSEIVVFIKKNPGMSRHNECKNNGYTRVAFVKVPAPSVGDTLSLSGAFTGNNLRVKYNGKKVWEGYVPWEHKGSSGVRTDNAKVSITLD